MVEAARRPAYTIWRKYDMIREQIHFSWLFGICELKFMYAFHCPVWRAVLVHNNFSMDLVFGMDDMRTNWNGVQATVDRGIHIRNFFCFSPFQILWKPSNRSTFFAFWNFSRFVQRRSDGTIFHCMNFRCYRMPIDFMNELDEASPFSWKGLSRTIKTNPTILTCHWIYDYWIAYLIQSGQVDMFKWFTNIETSEINIYFALERSRGDIYTICCVSLMRILNLSLDGWWAITDHGTPALLTQSACTSSKNLNYVIVRRYLLCSSDDEFNDEHRKYWRSR